MALLTLAVIASGVLQQPLPAGEIDNQLPPLAVATDPLKRTVELSLIATFRIWGSGFAPPNGIVKLIGFSCAKVGDPDRDCHRNRGRVSVVWNTS